jgi:phage terminase small subunit
MEEKEQKRELTPKQELFCKLYATEREYFGNGTQAYIKAYGLTIRNNSDYASARAMASENLTKPNILKRINELLEVQLNDENADRQLAFLMEQDADFRAKLGAIKEYNKLKSRIENKLDITSQGEKITGYTFEVVRNDGKED